MSLGFFLKKKYDLFQLVNKSTYDFSFEILEKNIFPSRLKGNEESASNKNTRKQFSETLIMEVAYQC